MNNEEMWTFAGLAAEGYSVEEIPQLSGKERSTWDKDVSFNTALRAIFLLYRRDRWEQLWEIGLEREHFEPLFKHFDKAYFPDFKGLLKTREDARALLEFVPGVGVAAADMLEQYKRLQLRDGFSLDTGRKTS